MHSTVRTTMSVVAGFVLGALISTSGHFATANAGDKEPTFVYSIHYISLDNNPETEMNKAGKEGWELVSVGPVEQTMARDNKGNNLYKERKCLMAFKKKQ